VQQVGVLLNVWEVSKETASTLFVHDLALRMNGVVLRLNVYLLCFVDLRMPTQHHS